QQQLVQIARVLTTGADILVFDEPTASLTNSEAEFLLKLMKKLKESGKSLVFISHHLEELLSTTDRITVLRDGCTVYVGDTKDVTKDFLIEKMAGKKVEKLRKEERKIEDVEYLRVENLTRSGEFSDVSFNVKKGEIFGIGGLVGSGRTELANAIFGLTKKSDGRIYLDGKEIEINSPSKAISLGIGYVPEERRSYGIFPILSVMENMVVSIYDVLFKGIKIHNKKASKITDEHIKKMRIRTPSAKTPIQSLSGGNQQKVILSRWMAKDVDLLILDEPTRGIDVNAKGEIYELIRQMTEQGMTVIIISSEHEELLLLSDRLMIMHEGKVKGIRENTNLKQQDILEMAFK
ncbi:MAG: sugar ABC transporter ATP-binding protein, partial [Clostridiales bacterium]|nr:sugar ABC transporter ATP-binding protein [Clostridiales bacterium]